MPTTVTSTGLSGDPSPRRLSRLRLRDRLNASTSSLVSNNSSGGNEEDAVSRPESSGGVRASMEKLKSRVPRRSSDGRCSSNDSSSAKGGNRLSALVHSRSRRKSRQVEDANRISQALGAHSNGSGEGLGVSRNASESSLVAGSDQSSLLTDGYSDSERYVLLFFHLPQCRMLSSALRSNRNASAEHKHPPYALHLWRALLHDMIAVHYA